MKEGRRGSVAEYAGASYVPLLLGVITGPVLARAVGPTGRGEIALVTVFAAILTTVAGLGVPLAIGHAAANKLQDSSHLIGTSVRLALWELVPALGIALALAYGPLSDITGAARVAAIVFVALAPVGVLTLCVTMIYIGEGMLRPVVLIEVVPAVALAAVVAVAYVGGFLTVWFYLAAMVGFTVLSLAIAVGWGAPGPRAALPLRPFLRFGARGYLGYLAALGTIRIDQVFVGPMLGARQLGYYAVAASIAQLPLTLGRAVASRAFGTVAQSEDRAELMSRYMRLSLLAAGILAVGVAVACPLVPLLYGHSFGHSLVPLLWLLPGSVVLCGSLTATSCLTSAGRPGQTTIAEAIGLGGTLVGLPLIVPRYGIRGAAIFSSVSYLVVFLTYRHFLRGLGVTRITPRVGDVAILRTSVARLLRRPVRAAPAP